ncbi:chromate efflux transporter [Candidatus Woesearchaeota archaeon]|nr:chromate efflux transporter [Candidatus Woesearchaeota archaeon]
MRKKDTLNDSYLSLFFRFLKFGFLAWGGPVAQISLMYEELVIRAKWMTEKHFTKVLAIYQAMPGPEATELSVYFGYRRHGRFGGLLSGLGFVLPGFLMVLFFSWFYLTYGMQLEWVQDILYGIKPVIIALIVLALLRIGKATIDGWQPALIAMTAFIIDLVFRPNLILLIFALGFLMLLFSVRQVAALSFIMFVGIAAMPAWHYGLIFLVFLKAGLVTFGGAYTVVPFIQEAAVQHYHWLTSSQFLDGMAISGMVPAPFIIVATFVGYLAGGFWGALLATIAIFLPAFLITTLFYKTVERLTENRRLQTFLIGVTAAVVGVIFVTAIDLARVTFIDAWTVMLGLTAFLCLWRWRLNIAVAILGSGAIGYLIRMLG